MSENNEYLHEVVITAIVVKDGKFLVTKRVSTKKRFPNKWTVAGGRLQTSDYTSRPKDTEDYWYNVLEETLKREVMEEVGLAIGNVQYVTSCARVHEDGAPSLVIACMADWLDGEVKLQPEETDDYAWVSVEEAENYDLIDGIYDEIVMASRRLQGDFGEWERH